MALGTYEGRRVSWKADRHPVRMTSSVRTCLGLAGRTQEARQDRLGGPDL
jgi:hypothetical protein